MEKKINKRNAWLITIDLDGTLLMDWNGKADRIAPGSKEILKKIIAKGHEVAIITGRPFKDAKKIYEELGLNTIIANYNGAFIHNPSDDKFFSMQSTMNRKLIQDVLNSETIKGNILNVIVEYSKITSIMDKNDVETMKTFHIYENKNVVGYKLGDSLLEDPFSVSFKIDTKKLDKYDVLYLLKREFSNAFDFRIWESRGEVNIEINGKFANKGLAMNKIASYYGISTANTIAFGDGLNDKEMLSQARWGVAMKNASITLKEFANDVTDYENNDSGVVKYLEKMFLK